MLLLAIILCLLIAVLVVGQLLGVRSYIRLSGRIRFPPVAEDELPPAAVLLSLRGNDPYLTECLQRLAAQDYPQYRLHVILDHPSDPARQTIEDWLQEHEDFPIAVDFLHDISPHTYLKTSALRQCISGLDANIGVVLLVDADTLVYDRWLRDTVTPMIHSDVGVVSGNRWYDPTRSACGSMVRCIYNTCCVSPMYFMRATWGGSQGVRRDVFAQDYFFDRMLDTPSEEQAIQVAARHANALVEVHPNIMILNREDCNLASCFAFMRRQLIWTRLCHPHWRAIILGVTGVYLLHSASFILALAAAVTGEYLVAGLLTSALLVQLAAAQFILEWLHHTIGSRMLAGGAEPFPAITMPARLRLLLTWPLGFLVLCWAAFSATVARRVLWRGITYQVIPPDRIRMTEYRPLAERLAAASSEARSGATSGSHSLG
ncbi:MAG: glycosyltransferase family 2 protein [Planctomycetales bacterium]|nr:glycosyltransferase family 2 protein [Planctomycetales bacterium]